MLKLLTATSVVLLTLANVANAYTLVSSQKTAGTITNIDANQKTFTVEKRDGSIAVFALSENGTIATNKGKTLSVDDLKIGNTVILRKNVNLPVAGEIKGQVLAVNSLDSTIKVLEESTQNILNIKLDDNVVVSGSGVDSLKNLQRGNELIVRNTAK